MPTKSITFPFRAIAALAALLAPGWATAQTVTLTVPFRGATSMQSASTTIEFDASALAGTATIGVTPITPAPAGTLVTLAVPASPCAGLACTATGVASNGDDILIRRISGTNRAQLELTYTASFGANYCTYTGVGAPGRTYDVTVTGFTFGGATNGYRITSFMAPSTESCDIPYARVPAPRPSLAGGGVTRLGRLPLNVVMVLDKSPSMAWTIPGSSDIRWDALKAAAQLFTNVWDVIGGPPPAPATILSEGHAEDRLGLVFFGGSAVESPLDGASFFKQRLAAATPWGPPVAAALAPGGFIGGTSIGAGTTNGRSRLDTVDAVQGDTAILLFTDGEQNTPPCIIHQGETTSPTTKPYPGLPGQTYLDQCTVAANIPGPLTLNGALLAQNVLPRGPIFTIGLGEGGMAASALLLDEIAQETAGQSRYPLTSASLTTTFIDTLVDNLKGGTVSTLEHSEGTVAASANASAPMAVTIDPSITRAVFVLHWDGLRREADLEIRRPDGTVVAPTMGENTANSRVAGINLPADGPAGVWQIRLLRKDPSAALTYRLSAYGVESRLSARITEASRLGTGSPIRIVAEVGWDDGGLANLPQDAIVATIERPAENLGNLLSAPLTGNPAPSQPDASPLMVKFHRLAETQGFLARLEPRPVAQKVTLVSVGYGRYEGTFDGANVGGQYRIRVDFDWNDPRTGTLPIRRRHVAERQVPVVPSAGNTTVQVQRGRDGLAVIVAAPADPFGNQVGPGFEGQFNVQVNGKPVGPVSDSDLTGGYTIRLTGVGPGDDPVVKIDYAGQTLRNAPLSQLGTPGGGAGNLGVWLALGTTFPRSDFAVTNEGGVAFNIGMDWSLTPATSIEGTFGWHRFGGKGADPDVDVAQFAIGGKWYFKPAPLRPYVTAGIGAYMFDPGSTHFGAHGGFGIQGDIRPHWSLDGRATLIGTTNNAPGSPYWTLQLGLRYGF